jgi:hypothetical protein
METGNHTIHTLFEQLGLDSSEDAIQRFLQTRFPLPKNLPLQQAAFWSLSQAQFLREAVNDDSVWSNVVDQLDVMLRQNDYQQARRLLAM